MNVFTNLINKRNLVVNSKFANVNPLLILVILLFIVYLLLKEQKYLDVNYYGYLQESS